MKNFFVWNYNGDFGGYEADPRFFPVQAENEEEVLRLAGVSYLPNQGWEEGTVVTRSAHADPNNINTRAFGYGYCRECRISMALANEDNGCTTCVA